MARVEAHLLSAAVGALLMFGALSFHKGSAALGSSFAAGEGGGSGASWASNGVSESSSGSLFRAVRAHKYDGPRLFDDAAKVRAKTKSGVPATTGKVCKNWAVTTTIFPPTTTVNQIAALPDWCLVIAGDKKTPKVYNVSGGAVYLSPADQEKMNFKTHGLLRWNHFGRKNLGFLYAIQHGARWVYDTDDDNELQRPDSGGIPLPRMQALVSEVATSHPLYNLYPVRQRSPNRRLGRACASTLQRAPSTPPPDPSGDGWWPDTRASLA